MSTPPAKPRVLLVDDSPLMRKAAGKMLGEEFDVVSAVDGVDGWDKIQADTSIQVIFTDLSMPRMDGYTLLQKIRASEDEGTLNMPVIVVTGAENDESARKKALDLGATDFITKPFGSIDLLARARAHANYRRIARRLEQQSTLDALTGLANKAGFLDRLQQDLAFARRHAQPLSLVRIEIDYFRNVFLKHGKAAAEALVRHVAHTLRDSVRKEDTAARIGLAGFALALPAGQHEGSKGHVERLRTQFARAPVGVEGKSIAITISAAVSTPELRASLTAAELLEDCEQMLQAALQAGGNQVVGTAVAETPPPASAKKEPMVVSSPAAAVAPPAKPAPSASAAARAAIPAAPTPAPAPPPSAAPKPSASVRPPASAMPGIAPAAAAIPAADNPAMIDDALQRIERGDGQAIVDRLPQILKRLLPLFRLLNERQRAQLVMYLQQLGS